MSDPDEFEREDSADVQDSDDAAEIIDAEVVEAEDVVADAAAPGTPSDITEEAVVALIAERDEYLEALQRLKADFANARRRSDEQAASRRTQAAADLVERLLPVLDSCDAALGQGVEEVRPVSEALFEVLSAQGLVRLDAVGEPFDPEVHEAVLYEEGEGEQIVIETLRMGYRWNERVLRPAMVKVQG